MPGPSRGKCFWSVLQTREVLGASSQLGRFVAEDMHRKLNFTSDVALQERTTFGVPAATKHHALVHSDEEVREALLMSAEKNWEPLILGGGSNVLMHSDWPGLTIEMNIKGIEVLSDDGNRIEVVVGAGESWHAWVLHAVNEGWNGLENLALIPGSVGASPMQNIGAYGVELKDRFAWLEAIHRGTGELRRFDHATCEFGYRESIFKRSARDQWIIVRVAFALERKAPLHTDYGAIQTELKHLFSGHYPQRCCRGRDAHSKI